MPTGQNLLDFHRGHRALAVTITSEEWKRETDVRLHPRSHELVAIDKALKDYHLLGKTEAAFVKLKMALDNWIRSQQRGGKTWTQSDRNRTGAVSKLHEQVTLVEAGRSVRQMGNTEDWEARKVLIQAEREAMKRLFQGRTLVFKHAAWKTKLNAAVNIGVLPTASIGMAANTAGREFMRNGSHVAVVPPQTVYETCFRICGSDPRSLSFPFSFDALVGTASQIFSMAFAPAKLLLDIILASKKVGEQAAVNSRRYAFRAGDADAALDCITRLNNRELKLLAADAGKQAASIVAGAFQAGPIASAATAIV